LLSCIGNVATSTCDDTTVKTRMSHRTYEGEIAD
jgi:hypothetical protein